MIAWKQFPTGIYPPQVCFKEASELAAKDCEVFLS